VEIVGIVADVRQFGPESDAPPTVYLSARQLPSAFMHVVVRTSDNATAVASTLREILRSIDPSLAPSPVRSMQVLLDESVAQPRLRMLLTTVFSSIAVMLTLVGGCMARSRTACHGAAANWASAWRSARSADRCWR